MWSCFSIWAVALFSPGPPRYTVRAPGGGRSPLCTVVMRSAAGRLEGRFDDPSGGGVGAGSDDLDDPVGDGQSALSDGHVLRSRPDLGRGLPGRGGGGGPGGRQAEGEEQGGGRTSEVDE